MKASIGEIIYEQVMSLDVDNNPVTGATFDYALYINNTSYSGGSVSYSLTDPQRGIFTFSWSGDSYGFYQLYVKNNITNVIFVSETIDVKPGGDVTVYVGL